MAGGVSATIAAYFAHGALDSAQVFELVELGKQLRGDGYDVPAEAIERGVEPIVNRFWRDAAVAGVAGLRTTAAVGACVWGYLRGRSV